MRESNLSIAPIAAAELPEVLALYAEVLDGGRALELAAAEAIWARMNRYPDYRVYLARRAGRAVGSFALLIMDNLGHLGTPSAIVEDVVVASAAQGQGIGREMMHYAMDRAREAGCYKLVLSSNQRRVEAHRFYEGLGFQRHGYSFQVLL